MPRSAPIGRRRALPAPTGLGHEIGERLLRFILDLADPGPFGDDGAPDPEAVWDQLRKVYDPEIPVNIVDLGLVYSMDVSKQDDGGHKVDVAMTLTAPGCGMGPAIAEDAKGKILLVPGVASADVRITWEPAWNQSMISEEGKMKLGLI